jgi:hypothetical protein
MECTVDPSFRVPLYRVQYTISKAPDLPLPQVFGEAQSARILLTASISEPRCRNCI